MSELLADVDVYLNANILIVTVEIIALSLVLAGMVFWRDLKQYFKNRKRFK